jgi:hypothetical protein
MTKKWTCENYVLKKDVALYIISYESRLSENSPEKCLNTIHFAFRSYYYYYFRTNVQTSSTSTF